MFDWNDLRVFLEVQRHGRLLTAARSLGVSHATVSRHLEALERALGSQLLVQQASGYQLTPAGQALLAHAQAMEEAALLAQEAVTQRLNPLGQVRVGVTEGLGTGFLARRLGGLLRDYPGLEVELVSVPRFVSVTNREADIAITLERPTAEGLIGRRLTPYRLRFYASRAYLDRAPPLDAEADLGEQTFIGYVDDLLFCRELQFIQGLCPEPRLVFRSTSVIAQREAACAGLGLAVLPCYLVGADSPLECVLPERSFTREYWISTHRELHRSTRLRVVWDFLLQLCAAERTLLLGEEALSEQPLAD
ncbi:LysR family transcriptional regulator [Pseudomonas oryzihabitans]|uniref:LysR family transcriptional regulator n=1 Tax=Pseudomonas oryzihabitans TaxID=47885 RepID=UPI00111DEC68|nr:LysR family transcriptional regulator [Pseudomonas psychrotolerans]QDD89553.1 LysR family transcriptional regulator [Pseudomonas psychrotolerans]